VRLVGFARFARFPLGARVFASPRGGFSQRANAGIRQRAFVGRRLARCRRGNRQW